ncbi:MAG: hypothetical protein AAF556_07530 [Pseudomonadota bacterium]
MRRTPSAHQLWGKALLCAALALAGVTAAPNIALAQDAQNNPIKPIDGAECRGYPPGPADERPTRAWTQCTADSDCVISRSMCDWPEAVAKTYLPAQQKYAACSEPHISCAYGLPPGPHRAICQDQRCQAIPIED